MLQGFKDFIMRGNIVERAVAVVIGTAFAAVVDVVVSSVVSPILTRIGGADVPGFGPQLGAEGNEATLINIGNKGEKIEIRNFLGEKRIRTCVMQEGVTIKRDDAVKDCLVLEGNDIDNVSKSAALIHMSCLVKKKDIRKFLDGFYVSEKGVISDE